MPEIVDAQLVNVVSFMPARVVDGSPDLSGTSGDVLAGDEFFDGVTERRFASPEHTSTELGVGAVRKLLDTCQVDPGDVDLILYSCVFNDRFWPGIGPAVQAEVGARNAMVMQVDTSCCSWLSAVRIAQAFIESGRHRHVVVLTVTNFISRLPEFQCSPRSRVLGDGASATLLTVGERSVLSSHEVCRGEHYGLMSFDPDLTDGVYRDYWERGCGPISVRFTRERLEAIRQNATELVPEVVAESLARAGLSSQDVSLLITHQPNTAFLAEWRRRCGIDGSRTHDTLRRYGNLFHGSIPVTLADALERGQVTTGDVLAFGSFANGGDMASGMVMRWTASTRSQSGGAVRTEAHRD